MISFSRVSIASALFVCTLTQVRTVHATQEVYSLPDNVLVIFEASNGDHWFGSNGQGAYRFDGEKLIRYTDRDGLASNHIVSIQEDHLGKIYLDTLEGISQFDDVEFKTLTLSELESGDDGWELNPTDLWFRGRWDENGAYRFDGESLYHLKLPRHPRDETTADGSANRSFSPYGIYSIHRDKNGWICIGTSNFGVCLYDGTTRQWIVEEELLELDEGPAPGVRSITVDRGGYVWFSNDLLHRYQFKHDEARIIGDEIEYQRVASISEEARDDWPRFCMSIGMRDNGTVWIATYDEGVWKYDGERVSHYPVQIDGKSVRLFSIYVDKNDRLWLGTHGHGALVFNGDSFERFTPTSENN